MTWGEFKATAEARGIKDDMDIWYIDVSYPSRLDVRPQDKRDKYPVRIGPRSGLVIISQ